MQNAIGISDAQYNDIMCDHEFDCKIHINFIVWLIIWSKFLGIYAISLQQWLNKF